MEEHQRRLLLREIESVRLIRVNTDKIEESWKIRIRDEVDMKIEYRTYIFNTMLMKFFEKLKNGSIGIEDGYWKTHMERSYIKNIHFFWRNECTCGEKECIHVTMKRWCNRIALRKTGEIGLGDRLFKFLY